MHHDFFVRCDGRFIRVYTREIKYLESLRNYVRIVTTEKTFLVLITMRQLEEELPETEFCRVHRSFIVALAHVRSFDHEQVYLDGGEVIPISPVLKHVLQTKVRVVVNDSRVRTQTGTSLNN